MCCTLLLRGSRSWPHAPGASGALTPPTDISPVVVLAVDWIKSHDRNKNVNRIYMYM